MARDTLNRYGAAVPRGDHPYTGREAEAAVTQAYGRPPREPSGGA